MFGMMLFLLALIAPLVAFSLYVLLKKRWPFRRLIPYNVAYGVGIGLVLGFGLRFEGVHHCSRRDWRTSRPDKFFVLGPGTDNDAERE